MGLKYTDLDLEHVKELKAKAHELGLFDEIIDETDRLGLIQCIFHHAENADLWRKKCKILESTVLKAGDTVKAIATIRDRFNVGEKFTVYAVNKYSEILLVPKGPWLESKNFEIVY